MKAHILIAWFSWSGHTRTLAEAIQRRAGGDLFEIRPVDVYPDEYRACVARAQEEQRTDARPVLVGTVPAMQQYNVVLVGYPNWCGSMPMPVRVFLETYDFSGKIIFPFCTHGGGGSGRSFRDVRRLLPTADVCNGFALPGSRAQTPQPTLDKWLRSRGFIH